MSTIINTQIRKSTKRFYGDAVFAEGLNRCGYFSLKEAEQLGSYGHTLLSLMNGTVAPENAEEQQFIDDLTNNVDSTLYLAKLWKKYLSAIDHKKRRFGFSKSESKTAAAVGFVSEPSIAEDSFSVEY